MTVLTFVKCVGAAAGSALVIWLMVKQNHAPFLTRLGIALLGVIVVVAVFALVVSARCDLGWLPPEEC